jgi:hypothetical protein
VSNVQDDQRVGTGHQVDRTIVRRMTQVGIWHMVQYPLQTVPAHAVWMMICSVRRTRFWTPGRAWSGLSISPQTSMHGAGTAERSSHAACAASRLQGPPWRHIFSVLHTSSLGCMAAQAGWEAGAVLFIFCVFSH